MESTYCGKDCGDCLEREEVGCPGCKNGPGKESGMLCEIAGCCRGRLKESCVACTSNGSCELFSERENMLRKWNGSRISEMTDVSLSAGTAGYSYAEQQSGRSRDGHDATFVRKSLLAIFWLFLLSGTGNVLCNEILFGFFPAIVLLGYLVSLGASIAQAILMIRLGREEGAYKVAGICILIATGLAFVGGGSIDVADVAVKYSVSVVGMIGMIFGLVLVLAAAILQIIGAYQFLVANARVVEYRDGALADRWIVMSKLLFVILGGIIVVPVLYFLLKLFGAIIGLLYILGVLAFGICEYVFLYQTANRFRE